MGHGRRLDISGKLFPDLDAVALGTGLVFLLLRLVGDRIGIGLFLLRRHGPLIESPGSSGDE